MKEIAKRIRLDILDMITEAGSGHIGGSLSAVELMVGLYFSELNHDPKNPWWPDRDRVIFSKGHASALLYSCLAESGYFPVEELKTFRKLGSRLQGHPCKNGLPGVEVSTGSLGMGLSVGVGMALGLRLRKKLFIKSSRVYVLIGDGECQCGQIWEAAMAAAHYQLNNLCVILDYNMLQIDGTNTQVMDLRPIQAKWRAFGWNIVELDGHDIKSITEAYKGFRAIEYKPTIIIARTIKGKGISFMENDPKWHGKVPKGVQLETAYEDLRNGLDG